MEFPTSGRIVDLTRKVYPGKERFRLEIQTFFVDEYLTGYKRRPQDHYIIQELTACSHIGTHVESPLHYLKDGKDVSEIPLQAVMGEAVVLDFSGKEPETEIGIGETKEKAGCLKKGDIALIRMGWDKHYATPMYRLRPWFTLEAIQWLLGEGTKCIGVDSSGIERAAEDQPIHRMVFEREIPMIEDMANLDQLTKERVFLIALPLKVHGLDSSPVRALAIEED